MMRVNLESGMPAIVFLFVLGLCICVLGWLSTKHSGGLLREPIQFTKTSPMVPIFIAFPVEVPEECSDVPGMSPTQLETTMKAVLRYLDLYSNEAVFLLMYTAAVETELGRYHRQLRSGPARGIFQMLPETEQYLLNQWLPKNRPDLLEKVLVLRGQEIPNLSALETHLDYQIAMVRILYLSRSEKLPNVGDYESAWLLYKKHHNTSAGQAKEKETIAKAKKFLEGK